MPVNEGYDPFCLAYHRVMEVAAQIVKVRHIDGKENIEEPTFGKHLKAALMSL